MPTRIVFMGGGWVDGGPAAGHGGAEGGSTGLGGWRSLTQGAAPEYDAEALERTAARAGHTVLRAIRGGAFTEFTQGFSSASLLRTFGCREQVHPFDNAPHSWTWFREPQIMAGLAHFLQNGPPSRRIERVRAFMETTYKCAGAAELTARITEANIVAAEAVAEEARVDLLVEATTATNERLGLVIESKFGHHLTPKQLPAARRHAASRGLIADNTAFVVVLPHRADVGKRILSRPANSGWRTVSWWTLLLGLERRLTPEVDSDAFRSLRHTIWQQTYG